MQRLAPTLSMLFLAASGVVAAAPPCVTFAEPLQPARVGAGAPVAFTVTATAAVGARVLSYEWKRDGRVVRSSKFPELKIAAAAATDAGWYTVDVVATCGTVGVEKGAALEVVSNGWAMITGRPLPGIAAADVPSLALCDDTVVAWVERLGGRARLRVHRADPYSWASLGAGALNTRPGSDAGEPSLQCSEFGGTRSPVLAFSESAAVGRTIEVRRFDGAAWQAVGTPASTPGADARRPLLRLVPPNATFTEQQHIQSRSAIAWLEGTEPRHQVWSAFSWAGLHPQGEVLGGHTLAVDTALRTAAGLAFPSLLAWIDDVDIGLNRDRRLPTLQSNLSNPWDPIGAPPAAPAAPGVSLAMVGIGFATENSRPRVALVWSEGAAAGTGYTLHSVTLFSSDYEDAQFAPFNTNPWLPYAAALPGTGLVAIAMDSAGQQGACYPTTGPMSFTLALTDDRNTRVLRADCRSGAAEWRQLETSLPVRAEKLDLKMIDWQTPMVATLEGPASSRRVAVWKYYR